MKLGNLLESLHILKFSPFSGPLALDYTAPIYIPKPPSIWSSGVRPLNITLFDLLYGPGVKIGVLIENLTLCLNLTKYLNLA